MHYLESRGYTTIVLVLCLVALSGCVSSSAVTEGKIDEILVEGSVYIKQGSYERAEVLFLNGLKQFPSSSRLLYNLGIVYALQGDFSQSITIFQSLNEITGALNVKYLKALGGVASAANSFEIASKAWLQVVMLDPLDTKTRLQLIQLFIDYTKYDEAYVQALSIYSLGQYSKELFAQLSSLEVLTGQGDGESWALIRDTY